MENDIIHTAVSAGNTIVLNGTEVDLTQLSVDQTSEKALTDQLTVTAAPSFLPEHAVLVETTRGLLLSVSDGAGGVTYGRITNPVDLQQTASLLVNCGAEHLVEAQHATPVFGAGGGGDSLAVNHPTLEAATDLCLVPVTSLVPTVGGPTCTAGNSTGTLEEEPKKRKGGWPKGKKRKNTSELNAPRAPVTGYVLYSIERRQEIKKTNPDLQFSEVTKVLGNEWSTMAMEKKQKYLTEAEADKKRYIDELNAFQQSVTYQSFLKKRKMKGGCVDPNEMESDAYATLIDLDENYMSELYCRVCDQYFSSLHNKKEHMFGRQHLQAITGELEKELQQQQSEQQQRHQQSLQEAGLAAGEINTDSLGSLSDSSEGDLLKVSGPVDIESFIREFHQKNTERDEEIRQLKRSLKMSQLDNIAMCKQIQEYKELEAKLEQDIGNAKAYSASLRAQIDGLKMVPTLFGVINF